MAHYNELIKADGSYNVAAIMQIALAKARTEKNAAICDRAGVSFSRAPGQSLGDAAGFYAREAAKIRFQRYVGDFQDFLSKELRAVWQVARDMKASYRPKATEPVRYLEAAE